MFIFVSKFSPTKWEIWVCPSEYQDVSFNGTQTLLLLI
jgi:hypothetical protein